MNIAAACFLIGLPMIWLTVRFTPRLRRRSLVNRRAYSNLTSRLQESLTAVKIVKANRAEGRILARFDADSHRALDAALAIRLDMAVLSLAVRTLGVLLLIVAEYVMVSWVIDDRETFLGAVVVSFIGFTVWNLGSFRNAREHVGGFVGGGAGLVRTWSMLQDLFVGLERAFYLLDLEPAVTDPDEPTAALDPASEHALVATLREIAGGRLVVIIAHRLSTIRRAERAERLASWW
jgi:ABC-type multidrug transport system fused ATPase/permease subunit